MPGRRSTCERGVVLLAAALAALACDRRERTDRLPAAPAAATAPGEAAPAGASRASSAAPERSAAAVPGFPAPGPASPPCEVQACRGPSSGRAVADERPPPAAEPADTTPPAAPQAVSATAASDRAIDLRWGATDDAGVAGYEVVRDGAVVARATGLASSVSGLRPGTEHCFRVVARDRAGNRSAPSPPACAATPDRIPPSAPAGVTARALSETEIEVAWGASSDDVAVQAYAVREGEARVADPAGTRAVHSGLRPDTEHCYRVRSRDAAGNWSGEAGPVCARTPDLTPPSPPSAVVAGVEPAGERGAAIRVRWVAASDEVGVVAYEVFRDAIARATVTGDSALDADVRPPNEYCYTVRARDAAGNRSPPAGPACAAVPDTRPPSAPRIVATPSGESQIELRCDGAEDDVGVVRCEALRGASVIQGTGPMRFAETGLRPFTEYCYTARAYDRAGNRSADAAPACATTLDLTAPSPPGTLQAIAASERQIDLRWSPGADNVRVAGYQVRRDGKVVADVPAPATSDTGLAAATRYCYSVASRDAAGNLSSEAGPVCAATPDETPPAPPPELRARAGSSSRVELTWAAAADNDRVSGYEVRRGDTLVAATASTAVAEGGLLSGVEYCYRVHALDPAGNRSFGAGPACATTPDVEPPAAPARPEGRAAAGVVALRWRPSKDNVAVVAYEVSRDGAPAIRVGGPAATDPGAPAGARSCYSVVALDAAGNRSGPSDALCLAVPDVTPPSVPGALNAAASERRISLGWSASVDDVGVAGYEVLRGRKLVAAGPSTTAVETGLSTGQRYCYVVRAYDAAGNRSAASEPVCAVAPDLVPPTPPVALAATAVAESEIGLRWGRATDNVGVVAYEVSRGGRVVARVASAAASERGLEAGKEYCYSVRALDAFGNRSGEVGPACATTRDVSAPTVPARLQVGASSETAIRLRWDASSDNVAVAGYELQRDGGPLREVAGTSADEGGLAAGTRYCYRVRARDAAGNRSPAVTGCAVTPDVTPPTAPAHLEAAPTAAQVALRWSAASDNVGVAGYEVRRGDLTVAKLAATVLVESGLAPLHEYCYTVRAYDAAGNRSPEAGPICAATVDALAPAAPRNLRAQPDRAGIQLSWEPSPRMDVIYLIHQDGSAVGATRYLSFLAKVLRAGQRRCYRVVAMDEVGRQSMLSNEACAASPTVHAGR